MKKYFILILCLCSFIMFGCASGNFNQTHTNLPKIEINNTKYVDTDPSDVWDTIVRDLAKTYFMINNIDKESRIINVSFYADTPCSYVECGTTEVFTKITMPIPEKGDRFYKYKSCEDTKFVTQKPSPLKKIFSVIDNVTRDTKLDGRMNIYVAPQGSGTLVTVNCRYILKVNVEHDLTLYNLIGGPIANQKEKESFDYVFDTLRPHQDSDMICFSNGNLETEILNLVR